MENFIDEINEIKSEIINLEELLSYQNNIETPVHSDSLNKIVKYRDWLKELLYWKSMYGSTEYIISDNKASCVACKESTDILRVKDCKRFCTKEHEIKYDKYRKRKTTNNK